MTNIRVTFPRRPVLRAAAAVYILRMSGFAFAGGLWCSTVASAMRTLVFLLAGLLATAGGMHGEIKTPDNGPIEITSTGQTTYENGLATARDNVAIHIGNTDIYAD